MAEERCNTDLSLREFYTSYHYCPTTEESQSHEKPESTPSQKSLPVDKNSLHQELHQFLSLLQQNPFERSLKNANNLPVILSATEESSCFSEKGDVAMRRIEAEIQKVDQKVKKAREKRGNNKENVSEAELLREKVELMQRKIEFLTRGQRPMALKSDKTLGKITKSEQLERKLAEFNKAFEQFIQESGKTEGVPQKKQRVLARMKDDNARYCEAFRKSLLVLKENSSNPPNTNCKKTRSLSRNKKKSPQDSQESFAKKKRQSSVSCDIPRKAVNNPKKPGPHARMPERESRDFSSKKTTTALKKDKIEETFRRFLLKSIKK